MTKKEKAEFERLLTRAALRSTSPVEPDVAPPVYGDGMTQGFTIVGPCGEYARVDVACSSSVYHGVGYTDKTTTQNPRWLYSSRLLALRALRYDIEQQCAVRLRRIDAMIEEEEAK